MPVFYKNTKDCLKIGLFFLASYLLPQRWWTGISRVLASIELRLNPVRTHAKIVKLVESNDGRMDVIQAREVLLRHAGGVYREQMEVVANIFGQRWRPDIQIIGLHHISTALQRGKGVILWEGHFTHSALVTKMALAQQGVDLHHVSSRLHGFSMTPFGVRYLNPLRVRSETRYLAERVEIDHENPSPSASLRLISLLRKNKVLSIRAVRASSDMAEVAFFHQKIQLSKGPVTLSMLTGASLLSLVTICTGEDCFEVHIADGLLPETGRQQDDVEIATIRRFAERNESFARRFPHLWRGWHQIN
jgi:lauroyl/myristoyl acyltransferase